MRSWQPLLAAAVASGTLLLADSSVLAAQDGPCTVPLSDAYRLADPPIYRACDVSRPARLDGEPPRLTFRPSDRSMATRAGCLRAEYVLVVDQRGRVDTASIVLLETNYPEYGQAVRETLARLGYKPAELDGVPVRQAVTYMREEMIQVSSRPVPFVAGRVEGMSPARMRAAAAAARPPPPPLGPCG